MCRAQGSSGILQRDLNYDYTLMLKAKVYSACMHFIFLIIAQNLRAAGNMQLNLNKDFSTY